MPSPDDRRYSQSHEWHKPEPDGTVTIGISQFAVDELNDITYVEVAVDSGPIEAGGMFGEVESVKANSELYVGVSGEVVEANQAVIDDPALINRDCFGEGWLVRVKPNDPGEMDGLLDATAYDTMHGG